MTGPSESLLRAMEQNKAAPPAGALERLRTKAARLRDIERELEDLAEREAALRNEKNKIEGKELVDLFDETGIDHIGVPATGNLPAVDVVIAPYFKASIAAEWPEERRDRAYEFLEEREAGDLIKTAVTFSFGRGEVERAVEFAERAAKELSMAAEVKRTVPWTSLTAWLRELYTKHRRSLSAEELQTIGGTAGRIAKIQQRKE